jgi:hypothetical protein
MHLHVSLEYARLHMICAVAHLSSLGTAKQEANNTAAWMLCSVQHQLAVRNLGHLCFA